MGGESAIYRTLGGKRKNVTHILYRYEPIHFVILENPVIRLDVWTG